MNKKLPKIELHVHLEGAVKYETIFELSKQKQIVLDDKNDEDVKNAEDVRKLIRCQVPKKIEEALAYMVIYMPVILFHVSTLLASEITILEVIFFRGDPDAIERIAYELCETQAENGVIYFEVRYCPHLMSNTIKNEYWRNGSPYKGKGEVTPEFVVQCVNRGLKRGQADFGLKVRSILCCNTLFPELSEDVLRLVEKYKSDGVVGIDMAGPAEGCDESAHYAHNIFQEAKRRNIHRTVHAGESGGAKNVKNAVDKMSAERIGHGYRVLEDHSIYEYMKKGDYHFETCPMSSRLTSAVLAGWVDHPVKVFASDNVNFSISTDDPTIFGNTMESEFKLCIDEIGLTYEQLFKCQKNAAKSCFLPEYEKQELIDTINTLWQL